MPNAPAVLLSQGLGFEPFDRDYGVPGAPALKSFVAIADALSRHGIVVLRVDDRGAGGSSGRKQLSSVQQLVGDLVAGVAFLKTRPEVDPKRIGIIGHSFAGLTAPMAAVRSNDVAFVITLAGLLTDTRINLERLPAGLRAVTTATWTALAQSSPTLSPPELEGRLRDAFTSAMANVSSQERASVQGAMAGIVTQWATPLRRAQALTDPGEALRALRKPFLAIHGAGDRELDSATNLGPLVRYLGDAANADVTVATIPDIDHWMWVCTQPSQPGKPCAEMEFSPRVLDLITNWIQKH
jgi:pimeloyl-ACP methyl ester carboxylesterase